MDKGYIENGFIVDVSNTQKASEILYELSRILDLPDAQSKKICLKLGTVDLTLSELKSIKALVESLNSEIEFLTTASEITKQSAKELDMKISELENKVPTPEFNEEQSDVNKELELALDKIFGDDNSNIKTFATEQDLKELKKESQEVRQAVAVAAAPEVSEVPFEQQTFEDFNRVLNNANETDSDAIEEIDYDLDTLRKALRETEKLPTLYIQRTLRSGQSITSDGNIVVIGDVNPGSEIIAKGDITVWGILGGIAHAGSGGNQYAKIRALKMNAIQLRIADTFARRPDSINIPYVQKTDTFVPEEACIYKKQILIHKLHES